MTTKKSAKTQSLKGTALEGVTPGMTPIQIAIGPNPNGLRHQTAIQQQPDETTREAVIAEIEAEG